MKLTKLTPLGLAMLFGLAVPATAFANGDKAGETGADFFKSMDTNGDGKISPDEHAAGAKKMFEMMDANKDGKVTADEMTAAHEKMMGKKAGATEMSAADKIKVMDTNGDGVLSADEHAAGAKLMFDKMDTDKDGFLSPAEVTAGHSKMMKK
jgi:Ca2+-binding EF-hand superfamily protein